MPSSQNCQARGKWAPTRPLLWMTGWNTRQLRLKETQDNEIIFNLCPFKALSTPVILDGIVREGSSQIHFKPGNYYTNYSLRCGVITSPRSGEYSSACTPAEARAARWNSCSTPFSLADIWPLVMFAICTLGGREKNSQKLLIAQQKQEWKAQVWPSVQPTQSL